MSIEKPYTVALLNPKAIHVPSKESHNTPAGNNQVGKLEAEYCQSHHNPQLLAAGSGIDCEDTCSRSVISTSKMAFLFAIRCHTRGERTLDEVERI